MITKINTVADLKTRRGTPNAEVEVLGYYTAGDGGGGKFYWDSTSTLADNAGNIIQVPTVTTGRWIGIFEDDFINARRFGVKADNTQNDLPFLNTLTAYCIANRKNIYLPEGVIRITDTWYIGGPTVSAQDAYDINDFITAPSFNGTNHIAARLAVPIKVRGCGRTYIHGDFNPGVLTAIVYYNIQGANSGGKAGDLYTGEFSNIGIYAQGMWTGTNVYVNPTATNPANNQVGLLCLNTLQLRIQNLTFIGLKLGMLHNNTYFSQTSDIYWEYCVEGFTNLTSAGSKLENFIAYYCDLAYNIRGGQIHMSSINVEHCGNGLWIKTSNIVINGSYLEQIVGTPINALIIGLDPGDPGYTVDSRADRIVMNGVTIAGGTGASIWMKDSARRLYFNSVNANGSQGIKLANALNRIFVYSGQGVTTANVTTPNLGKIYQRNEAFEADSIVSPDVTISNLLNVTGNSTFNTQTSTGNAKHYGGQNIRGNEKHEHYIEGGSTNHSIYKFFLPLGLGVLDKILVLGKFSSVDNTRINGRINVIAASLETVFQPSCIIDVTFLNDATGRFSAGFSVHGSTDSNTYTLVTYVFGGETYVGIRILTTSTARTPTRFYFDGHYKAANAYTFTVIDSSTVTSITPQVLSLNSFFDVHTSRFLVPAGKIGVGLGVLNPTAKVDLAGGSATAGTAPLKIGNGTLMTVAEAGAFESDGAHLFFTVGTNRRKISPNVAIVTITTNTSYTDHKTAHFNTASGNITYTINPVTLFNLWGSEPIVLMKLSSDANIVTITPSSGTINGQSSIDLINQYEGVRVYSDNTNLYVI